MQILEEIARKVVDGGYLEVKELTQSAVNQGINIKDILDQGLVAGMSVVGERFKKNEVFLPNVLMAARAMKSGMEILEPLLIETGTEPIGRIALGAVQGDIHDIGKNLVAIVLKGAGFEVIDLGVNVPPQRFVKAAKEGVPLIGMSALLGTTMPFMKINIEAFEEAGVRDQVKIIIGGAVVSQAYADQIGADGYAPDAVSAVDEAKRLLSLS